MNRRAGNTCGRAQDDHPQSSRTSSANRRSPMACVRNGIKPGVAVHGRNAIKNVRCRGDSARFRANLPAATPTEAYQ